MEDDGFTLTVSKKRTKKHVNLKSSVDTSSRDPVSTEDVQSAMKWAESNSAEAASTLFSLITSLLKEKTVIQMQLYGIGKFDQKHSNGAFQLAVALNLFARFKEMFSETTVTFQDPIMAPAEAEYLHLKGVRIIHGNSFTSNHFIQASTTAAIPGPAFICYMIHSDWEVFDEFLAAHWDSQLLSRIIFVGNELRSLDSHPKFHSISPRIKEFSKLCDSKSFKCEKDTVASAAFHLTDVFVISQKNAEFLVNLFK